MFKEVAQRVMYSKVYATLSVGKVPPSGHLPTGRQ